MKARLKRIPGLVSAVHAGRSVRGKAKRSSQSARFAAARMRRGQHIEKYLRTHEVRRLQLGTGSNPYDGWLNTDVTDYRRSGEVVYLDAREPFPLPDSTFDAAFSEHVIEHLAWDEGLQCLRECYRVLRPGGRIRIATPSLRKLARLYDDPPTNLQRRYMAWSVEVFAAHADVPLPGFVLNNMFHNFEHRFVYDDQTLRHALESVGFSEIREWPVGESDDPALTNLERHMRSVAEFNAYETLVLEAVRPPAAQ